MQKIRLLLTLCTLSAMPSLQSAASALMKPVTVQVTQSASNNKLITISRSDNEIVTFNAGLLANHDFSSAIQEFKGTDKAFIIAASTLFEDLNDDQIHILVKALNEDINPAKAKAFIETIDQHDFGWLTNKANFAEMNNIYEALAIKIASNPELAQSLHNDYTINDNVSEIVGDKIDMKPVDNAIFNRISHSCSIIISDERRASASFNADNNKLLVGTMNRVILVDLNTNHQTTLYTKNEYDDWINSAIFNGDYSKILITTEKRVILIDLNTNQQITLYTRDPQLDGNSIYSATLNADSSKILIRTRGRIILFDLNTNHQTILYTSNPQLDGEMGPATFNNNSKVLITTGGKIILIDINTNQQTILYTKNLQLDGDMGSATFNTDNSQVLITTTNRVILVDIQNPNQQFILYTTNPQLDGDWIESAIFNANNSKFLITTEKRVILIDLNTNQQITLYTRDPQLGSDMLSATFSTNNSKVLITARNKISLVDLNTNQQTILYTRNLQREGTIVSAIFNADNSQVLITTDHRIILCQISSLSLLKRLDIDQKLFLINVSKAWEYNEPYIIQSDEEKEMYNSFPAELQRPELFEIAPEPCKR